MAFIALMKAVKAVPTRFRIHAHARIAHKKACAAIGGFQAQGNLPGGIQILPATLVRVQNINNTVWNPSSPDPSGIDYWPQQNRFVITVAPR